MGTKFGFSERNSEARRICNSVLLKKGRIPWTEKIYNDWALKIGVTRDLINTSKRRVLRLLGHS